MSRERTLERTSERHYLETELLELVQSDPRVLQFLDRGVLDGIWFWNIEKPEDEWLSPRFKELFGYRDDEIPNSSAWWQENIHPDDLAVAFENFRKHCADPEHPYDQVVRYRHRDGSTVWVRCRGIAIRDEGGRPVRMLGVHIDVSEFERTKTALETRDTEAKEQSIELQRSNRDLDRFAYMSSHDLRGPVRAIRYLTDWIAEDTGNVLSEESREHLATLQERIGGLDALIGDILEYSRTDRSEVTPTEISTAELVRDIARGAEFPPSFVVDVDDGMPTILARVPPLRQVFAELLTNAIEHHDRDAGHIRVSGEDGPTDATFVVEDDGPGIPARLHTPIFEPFRTGRPRHESEGSGMGLALIRKTLEKEGGTIRAESRDDRGTRFVFTWPKTPSKGTRSP